jgi:hypothetical protein
MALIANKTVPSLSVRAEIIEEEGIEVLQIQIFLGASMDDLDENERDRLRRLNLLKILW